MLNNVFNTTVTTKDFLCQGDNAVKSQKVLHQKSQNSSSHTTHERIKNIK